jgi:hypothetical protein
MSIASTLISKVSSNPTIAATRTQAEQFLSGAQTKLFAKHQENTIRISKLAQKNLTTLAKGADKISQTLTELSEKLEPTSKPVVAVAVKPARKVGAKKPVVKAAAKIKAARKVRASTVASGESATA